MNLFDILGPIMVGPSSSHTAGAVRIGYVCGKLLQDRPVKAQLQLHGSFATTGVGHGTDRALIAGLLGMLPDDERIPQSMELAAEEGLEYSFQNVTLKDAHPNTTVIHLWGENDKQLEVQAASIGGGRIMIHKLDGIDVNFSAGKPTLIVNNIDQPGHLSNVTSLLAMKGVNIATLQLYRDKRGGLAVMVVETDQDVPQDVIKCLEQLDGIRKVVYINIEM